MPITGPNITTLRDGTVRVEHPGGKPVDYIETGAGTFYHAQTPRAVVEALEEARLSGRPTRLFYGDTVSGRDWMEENDVKGSIGRSMGPLKVPLLVERGQDGGGALLDHCVVRIQVSGRDVYRHPLYNQPSLDLRPSPHPDLPFGVFAEGQNRANFATDAKRREYVAFLRGDPKPRTREAGLAR